MSTLIIQYAKLKYFQGIYFHLLKMTQRSSTVLMACTYTSHNKCMCFRIDGEGPVLKYKYMKGTGNGISLS